MARVLIADDENVSRVVLRHLLATAGHEVLEAPDGAAAAELLATEHVDLVISDQEMPGLTGLELRRRLGDALACPFVLLTGYATEDEFGADELDLVDAYLTKPVSSGAITVLLERFGL